jgi:uncharacterized integral membrane protein
MKALFYPLMALITAKLVIFVALLAQQNATPIALTFLNAQSIELPIGFILAIAIAVGILTPPIIYPLLRILRK